MTLTGAELPSALLLDSGGGWLENDRGGCLTFGKPQYTLLSETSGSVMIGAHKTRKINGDPFREIEKKTSEGYVAVGFVGYEYLIKTDDGAHLAGKMREKPPGGSASPLLAFHFYDKKSVTRADVIPQKTICLIRDGLAGGKYYPDIRVNSGLNEKRFVEMVKKIKSYISAGDVYQVNISGVRKFSRPKNPSGLFLKLFESQPVPFASYMDFGEFQFLSGSMELFLKKTGNLVFSRPIKGTIKRGKNFREDSLMRQTLADSEKEKAEILMITDLMRNDLSRICIPSSVKTRKIFNIKPYKTLFHMEAEIEGTLRKNISISEIIQKTFPPGSVTGAPKTKALEIVDSLEPHSRGPYCGVAGIFYPDGNFCLSVSIRCLQVFSDEAVCWSGAGIVWDSDPVKEFEETLLKLSALRNTSQVL